MAHLKRLVMPISWSLPRKTEPWAIRPEPGRHPLANALPLGIVLRDYLGVADTAREASAILAARQVLVDGKVARSAKLGVGLMDVIAIPSIKGYYRVLPDKRSRLQLEPIPRKNASWKLARIENKTVVAGGKFQLNLHDGRNILDSKNEYATGDVLKIGLPDQKILAHYPLAKGNLALVIGGRHSGEVSQVETTTSYPGVTPTSVSFKGGFTTIKAYTFIIGSDKTEIKLPREVGA